MNTSPTRLDDKLNTLLVAVGLACLLAVNFDAPMTQGAAQAAVVVKAPAPGVLVASR